MKSLLISGAYFPPQVGGISRILESLALEMGPDRACCLTGTGPGPTTLGPARCIRVYRSPVIFSNASKLVRAPEWARVLCTIILRERPSAVLLGTVDDGIHGRWLRRWLGLPYVVLAHGNEIVAAASRNERGGHPGLVLEILANASRVLAFSRFTAKLVEQAGVDPSCIDTVPPGCDSEFFSPRPPDPQLRQKLLGGRHASHVILTTGNLVPRKGHDVVIQALPHLITTLPEVAYVIVGDGPNRGELEKLAAELGVQERVIFVGRVPDAELPTLYALSDVFIMASRARADLNDVEGFGLVFLEANACGKPVIGGRSGGISDAIVEGETGLLVDPLDPRDVAGALQRVLLDGEFATRLGTRGRERVVRDFTWASLAERVQGTLERAARS